MSKTIFTAIAMILTLTCLATEANAKSKAQLCERVRQVCLGTGKSAEFCQANVEHCLGHPNHTGGLTSSTDATKAFRDVFWWGCA
jgi:hypothetical protein